MAKFNASWASLSTPSLEKSDWFMNNTVSKIEAAAVSPLENHKILLLFGLLFFMRTTFILFKLAAAEITPYIEIFSLNPALVESDKDFSKLSASNSPS